VILMAGDAKGIHISRIWGMKAFDFEQVIVDNTAGGVGLTAAKYAKAAMAYITIDGADGLTLRYRYDGGAPTSSIGHLAYTGDPIVLESAEDIANFKAIRTGSTSLTLNITYSTF
jgi:hypothetical protein